MVLSPQLHTTRLPPHILTLSFMGRSLIEKFFYFKAMHCCVKIFLNRCKLNFSDCKNPMKLHITESRNIRYIEHPRYNSKMFLVIYQYGFLAYIIIKKIKWVFKTYFSFSCMLGLLFYFYPF